MHTYTHSCTCAHTDAHAHMHTHTCTHAAGVLGRPRRRRELQQLQGNGAPGPRPAEPTLPGARGAGRPPAGAGGFTPHPTARVTPARHPSPGGHLCIIVPARKVHGEGRWPWPFLREKGGARRGCRVRLATVTVTVSGESSDTAPKCLKPRTMPTKRLVRAVRGRRAPRLRTLAHDWPHLF